MLKHDVNTNITSIGQGVTALNRKEGRFGLDTGNKFCYCDGGEALAQVAHRSCGCPLPGSVQGQVGRGFERPALMEGVPAHGRVVATK